MITEKINELTNNVYKGFIVKKAEYNIARNVLDVCLVFPESYYKKIKNEDKVLLNDTINKIVGTDIKCILHVEYSFADSYTIKNTVFAFLTKTEPLYCNNITADDVKVIAKDNEIKVSMTLDSGTYSHFVGSDVDKKLKNYLEKQWTQEVWVSFVKDETKDATIEQVHVSNNIYMQTTGLRTVKIDKQKKLVGKAFMSTPKYIVDLTSDPKETISVCGKVSNIFTKFLDSCGKTLLKFNLNDTTGSVSVVKFDKSKKEEYKLVEEGMEVVVQGKASINSYDDKLQVMANNISSCTIDYSSIDLTPVYNSVPLYYVNVFPKKYVEQSQINMFEKVEATPDFIKGKTFVAFDLETTGITDDDRIIEIGAVKMVNGEITEIFETLVNPEMHIPESASKVNNIFDVDVAGERTIEEVFPDFCKFIDGASLIAHNIEFDIGFVKKVAQRMNYKIDNEQFDTLALSRKMLKLAKYNLGAVCKYFDIDLLNAHRACYDAVACLKIFNKLAKDM